MTMFDLHGQVAVITGATRGLGQAMAVALAEAGADIALVQRSAGDTATKELVEAAGRRCEIILCDLAEMDQVKQVMDQVDRLFGRVDILVNNGGIQRRSHAEAFEEVDWDDVLDVNLKTVFLLCQQAGRRMIAQGAEKSSISRHSCRSKEECGFQRMQQPKAVSPN